jgi:hypothetical protein
VPDGPLPDVLAAAVLAVALFCACRLVVAALMGRRTERDVDAVHVVMGVSMAGMLTGWLAGSWTEVWLVTFAGTTVWFGVCVARELRGARPAHGGGHLPHLVSSAAMLYMVVAMRWVPMGGGSHAMSQAQMTAGGTPVLALVVATLLVADAVVSAGRLLVPVGRQAAPVSRLAVANGGTHAAARDLRGTLLAPRCTAWCLLVMSAAMAYMFVTARP